MNEKLPEKYKDNIFHKIFNKLRLLFFKSSNATNEKQIENCDDKNIINSENKFANELKVKNITVDTEYEKKKFMENLTNNPELLENFSIDRLEKILQYYLNENEKKRETLKKFST